MVAYIKTFSPKWKPEAGQSDHHPAQSPPRQSRAFCLAGAVSEDGMLEMPRSRGPRGWSVRQDPHRQQRRSNPPYDFSTGSRFMCGVTNRDLYKIFMTGLDGTPMPSFADDIKPADAWDLVHFLRTLQPLDTPRSSDVKAWLASHAGELKPSGPGKRTVGDTNLHQ